MSQSCCCSLLCCAPHIHGRGTAAHSSSTALGRQQQRRSAMLAQHCVQPKQLAAMRRLRHKQTKTRRPHATGRATGYSSMAARVSSFESKQTGVLVQKSASHRILVHCARGITSTSRAAPQPAAAMQHARTQPLCLCCCCSAARRACQQAMTTRCGPTTAAISAAARACASCMPSPCCGASSGPSRK